MKLKNCMLTFVALLLFSTIMAQEKAQKYSYDANGNRTSRALIVQKSARVSFPIASEEDIKEELIQGDPLIKVFPNPTRGLLKIEFTNLESESIPGYGIYDLSGTLLLKGDIKSYPFEIDLSRFKDGVYLLRIIADKKAFDWKIIKSGY